MGHRAGRAVRVFDTALGRIGILIGYDAEFPLLARAMAEAGAEVLLVPSAPRRRAATGGCGWGRWRGRWRTSASWCMR